MGRERRLRGSSPIVSFRGGAAKKLTAAALSSSWQWMKRAGEALVVKMDMGSIDEAFSSFYRGWGSETKV
jgi:hypothetical protein